MRQRGITKNMATGSTWWGHIINLMMNLDPRTVYIILSLFSHPSVLDVVTSNTIHLFFLFKVKHNNKAVWLTPQCISR